MGRPTEQLKHGGRSARFGNGNARRNWWWPQTAGAACASGRVRFGVAARLSGLASGLALAAIVSADSEFLSVSLDQAVKEPEPDSALRADLMGAAPGNRPAG